jgi:hypothetical protein
MFGIKTVFSNFVRPLIIIDEDAKEGEQVTVDYSITGVPCSFVRDTLLLPYGSVYLYDYEKQFFSVTARYRDAGIFIYNYPVDFENNQMNVCKLVYEEVYAGLNYEDRPAYNEVQMVPDKTCVLCVKRGKIIYQKVYTVSSQIPVNLLELPPSSEHVFDIDNKYFTFYGKFVTIEDGKVIYRGQGENRTDIKK